MAERLIQFVLQYRRTPIPELVSVISVDLGSRDGIAKVQRLLVVLAADHANELPADQIEHMPWLRRYSLLAYDPDTGDHLMTFREV